MIRPVLQIASGETGTPDFAPGDILDRSAWPAVEQIAGACLVPGFPGVLQAAELLLGLGEGLTPSGDDFLGGLFFAFYLLLHAFPHHKSLQIPNLLDWIAARAQSTNLISFTLLKDNIAGHALEPLHRFGIALLTNQPLENVISAAAEVIRVGHTTGWSLLAGLVTGMLPAFQKKC
jgi:hypothetical protein